MEQLSCPEPEPSASQTSSHFKKKLQSNPSLLLNRLPFGLTMTKRRAPALELVTECMDYRVRSTWVQVLVLPLTIYEILRNVLNLAELQLSYR